MATVGDIGKTENIEVISRGVKGSTTITKGDLVSFDTNGYARDALTTDFADVGFAVAIETQANAGADDTVFIRLAIPDTYVYIKAGGTIKPMHLVKVSTATSVVSHNIAADITITPVSSDVNSAKYAFALAFGRYIAHENEEQDATDAASTDVILVRLGP
jgi:hypothetical protein